MPIIFYDTGGGNRKTEDSWGFAGGDELESPPGGKFRMDHGLSLDGGALILEGDPAGE